MKRVLVIIALAGILSGCEAQPTWETVEDILPVEQAAVVQQLYVDIPEEAASPTFQDDAGTEMYLCQGYSLTKQIFDGGDLEKTVKTLSGQSKENLQILKTKQDDLTRYDFVWSAAGEDGLQVGRACILDDNAYHYAVSTMAQEKDAGKLQETWQEIFESCRLLEPDINLSTGS